MVTGQPSVCLFVNIDLVREQIRIAEGHALDIPPDRICLPGKAIQVRINAEDPWNDFAPDGGKTIEMYLPTGGPGIRFGGIVFQGYRVPLEYDSLLVKMTAPRSSSLACTLLPAKNRQPTVHEEIGVPITNQNDRCAD